MNYKYPLFWPYMDDGIKKAVMDTLNTRWLGQGPQVDDFENRVVEKFGVRHALAVSSGSAALETAYDLLDIQEGDEVLVPILTCTATNIPLLRKKAKLVFIDVDQDTLCPDIKDIASKVTEKTKAIVTVHLGGIECPLGPYLDFDGKKIPVVDDAAQAFGIFNGTYTATSFQAIKFFTTGDGGMFFCQDGEDYRKAKLMRWFGIDRDKKRSENWQAYKEREMTFDIEILGYKRQMTDIAAAMGIAGLNAYTEIMRIRKELFDVYREELYGIYGLQLLHAHDGEKNLHWLATVMVTNRDDFARKMTEHGIETNLVQLRNDIYKVFGGRQTKNNVPNMDFVEDKYLCLPLNPHLTKEDVHNICSVIKEGW
jgi:dTDP-4-amino-4,6-dideoxygalactose transaminase